MAEDSRIPNSGYTKNICISIIKKKVSYQPAHSYPIIFYFIFGEKRRREVEKEEEKKKEEEEEEDEEEERKKKLLNSIINI